MFRKLIAITFAFLLVIFISNKLADSVQGQSPEPENQGPAAQVWRCLKAAQVGERTPRPPKEVDITLNGKGFGSLQDIYIVACVPAASHGATWQQGTNYRCTTGNGESDRLLFGSDLSSTISPLTMQIPKGTAPPATVQAIGDTVDLTAHLSNAEGHVNYAFFGVTVSEPQLIPGQGSTIQYGTFAFQQDPSGCLSIRWDPYGRVFDSQSLEPISRVRVTLLDKNKQFVNMPGLSNPETTEEDGLYNFFVDIKGTEPETFYVNPVALAPLTHTFTATPNLHPNFDKAYYDIYKPDEPIVEAPGVPEHRDIPLDPGSGTPFRSEPKLMSKGSVRLGTWIRYEGVVSHPLSYVNLVGTNSGEQIAQAQADKEGAWSILLRNNEIPHNESLTVQIEKVDITTLSQKTPSKSLVKDFRNFLSNALKQLFTLVSKNVSAQTAKPGDEEFPPILTYVEGYAKDSQGNALSNATVNVRLEMSNGVYTQTKTDENGFFTIAPERLPIFNYYLEFVSPDTVRPVKLSTTDFVKDNEEYLATNNINLMAATKNGESLLPPLPSNEEEMSDNNVVPTQAAGGLFAGSNMNLILMVIALIVLLGVTGGVLMYIKKKRSESNDLL